MQSSPPEIEAESRMIWSDIKEFLIQIKNIIQEINDKVLNKLREIYNKIENEVSNLDVGTVIQQIKGGIREAIGEKQKEEECLNKEEVRKTEEGDLKTF